MPLFSKLRHQRKRFRLDDRFHFFLVATALAFFLMRATAGSAADPASPAAPVDDESPWKSFEKSVVALLGPIGPEVNRLHLQFELTAGPTFLGSGTLFMEKNALTILNLYSRSLSCLYRNENGTATCSLSGPGKSILFRSGGDSQVPVPSIGIGRNPDQTFNLEFQMVLSSATESAPIKLFLDPDVSAYIVKRVREKFPIPASGPDFEAFSSSPTASPSLTVFKREGRIHAFQAWFAREGKPPIGLKMFNFTVNEPLPAPPVPAMFTDSSIPSGKLETTYVFIKEFYGLIGDFVPREGE